MRRPMQAVVAKCENCGAALRVDGSSPAVTCAYCGVASTVIGGGAEANAPRLRIEPAPAVKNQGMGGAVVAVVMGVAVLVCLVKVLVGGRLAPLGGAAVFAVVAGIGVYGYTLGRREATDLRWFRAHGLAGRATVDRIVAATQGHAATLRLRVELLGLPRYDVEHRTTIPPLIVPRLTEGMPLPILAHPENKQRIEVQWHLV